MTKLKKILLLQKIKIIKKDWRKIIILVMYVSAITDEYVNKPIL